jgi:hypothetical protein
VLITVLSLATVGSSYGEPPQTRKNYALIIGTVWNAQDRPASGIPIKIRLANEKKARWELLSDHRGEFAQRVPTGAQDYVIWADIKVGKGKTKPETKVHVESDERVDVALHLRE